MTCFLCEWGECFLRSIAVDNLIVNVYASLFPDLDEDSVKPLHVLVAPEKHFESIFEMTSRDYAAFTVAVRKVQEFYLDRGYGPAVTELRLQPGPHTPHVHVHLIFSSDPLRPLNKEREKKRIEGPILECLKMEIGNFWI